MSKCRCDELEERVRQLERQILELDKRTGRWTPTRNPYDCSKTPSDWVSKTSRRLT